MVYSILFYFDYFSSELTPRATQEGRKKGELHMTSGSYISVLIVSSQERDIQQK